MYTAAGDKATKFCDKLIYTLATYLPWLVFEKDLASSSDIKSSCHYTINILKNYCFRTIFHNPIRTVHIKKPISNGMVCGCDKIRSTLLYLGVEVSPTATSIFLYSVV